MFMQDHKHGQRRNVAESHLSQRRNVAKHSQSNVATLSSNVATIQRVQFFNVGVEANISTFPRELQNAVCQRHDIETQRCDVIEACFFFGFFQHRDVTESVNFNFFYKIF